MTNQVTLIDEIDSVLASNDNYMNVLTRRDPVLAAARRAAHEEVVAQTAETGKVTEVKPDTRLFDAVKTRDRHEITRLTHVEHVDPRVRNDQGQTVLEFAMALRGDAFTKRETDPERDYAKIVFRLQEYERYFAITHVTPKQRAARVFSI